MFEEMGKIEMDAHIASIHTMAQEGNHFERRFAEMVLSHIRIEIVHFLSFRQSIEQTGYIMENNGIISEELNRLRQLEKDVGKVLKED